MFLAAHRTDALRFGWSVGPSPTRRTTQQSTLRRNSRHLTRTPNARSFAHNLVKLFVDERLHSFTADVSLRCQLAEAPQNFLFRVCVKDKHTIVSSQCPILAFDFHTSLRGNFIESVSTIGGLFKVFRTRFGEAKEADVSGHNIPFSFLADSEIPSCAPETPVLMVSGSLPVTDNRIENLTRLGFLPKPFAFHELLRKVRTLIQAEAPFPIQDQHQA
jgi:hypothetical protein